MTITPERIARIIRAWAAETHLAPTTTRRVISPALRSGDGAGENGPELAFTWRVPDAPGVLPGIADVELREAGRTRSPGPEHLLGVLCAVAGFRAAAPPPEVTETDIAAADRELAELAATGAPADAAASPADGDAHGHVPGSWMLVRSRFFPTLPGTGGPPGMLWAPTSPWGGPCDHAVVPPIGDLDYPAALARDIPGFEARPATPSDAALIGEWMRRPHLATTFRQAWDDAEWRRELTGLRDRPDVEPLVLRHLGRDIGYVEVYRPARMTIGAARPTDPATAGIHIGLADATYIRGGLGRRLLTVFGETVLRHPDRVSYSHALGEPDIRNPAMVGAVRRTVAHEAAVLAFPHKCARLFSNGPVRS